MSRVRPAAPLLIGALVLVVAALRASTLLGQPAPEPQQGAGEPAVSCTRTAGPGSAALVRLVRALRPGQTGCLHGGTYRADVKLARPRVTLRAVPGERPRVIGRLWIARGADRTRVVGLALDGRNGRHLPSPTVNAADVELRGNDITNHHTGICLLLGTPGWGRAVRTVVRENRIHDCGRRPSTNQDHGIYVAASDDARILANVIYDNVDRGIQLYPDAQRTVVRGNIIDGNGEGIIFSGADGAAASDTIVEGNIVSNSRIRTNVESWYPAGNPIGARNVVRNNCLWQGAGGLQNMVAGGFTMTDNLTADPQFVDRAAGDFRLKSGSRCATILATSQAPAGAGGQSPVTGAPADPGTTTPPSTGGGTATPPTSGGGSGTPTTPPATGGGSSTPTTPPSTGTVKKVWHCVYVRVNGKRVRRCSWVPVTQAKAAVVRTTSRAAKPKPAKTAKAVKHRRRSAR
jgi:parallel beta-helix repeat protein